MQNCLSFESKCVALEVTEAKSLPKETVIKEILFKINHMKLQQVKNLEDLQRKSGASNSGINNVQMLLEKSTCPTDGHNISTMLPINEDFQFDKSSHWQLVNHFKHRYRKQIKKHETFSVETKNRFSPLKEEEIFDDASKLTSTKSSKKVS